METFAVEADVPGGPNAASCARRLVHEKLSGRVPDAVLPDVALLVTELVANGVRHGGAHAGADLHVRFEGRPAALFVEVLNADGASGLVGVRTPDLTGGGGLGRHIVERVATRWGIRKGRRTAVWFELDCARGDLL
jgi:hypothetical protein